MAEALCRAGLTLQVIKPINKRTTVITNIVLIVVIVALLITNSITLKLYLDTFIEDDAKVIDDTGDELSRVKFFIKDWYDELSFNYGSVRIFNNELQAKDGKYTLTIAGNRIRAVYPRGVRYFPLKYVTYIDFVENEDGIQCRLFYNETGTSIFTLR
jgi:hypothetical protein